jgi:spore maturation protein CgeB
MSHRLNIAFFGSSLVSAHQNAPVVAYYRGLIRALSERGHRVAFYEPNIPERFQHRDLDNPHWAKSVTYRPTDEAALDALERAEQSDLIIKCSGVGVCDDLLEAAVLELKKPETLVAFLDVTAPLTLDRVNSDPEDYFRPLIPEYDFVLTRGGGAAVVDAYRALGATDCIPIYNALDPNLHFPIAAETRFKADLGLLNDRAPEREARVTEFFFKPAVALPDRKFLLGGGGWQEEPMPPNVGCIEVPADQRNAFNCSTRAVLAMHCGCASRYGFSPPSAIFEAAGAGACLITDKWEGIELFLEPGRELLTAANGDEVAEHLRTLTPERARQLGDAAHARVLAAHTYAHRAAKLERVLEEKAGRVIA